MSTLQSQQSSPNARSTFVLSNDCLECSINNMPYLNITNHYLNIDNQKFVSLKRHESDNLYHLIDSNLNKNSELHNVNQFTNNLNYNSLFYLKHQSNSMSSSAHDLSTNFQLDSSKLAIPKHNSFININLNGTESSTTTNKLLNNSTNTIQKHFKRALSLKSRCCAPKSLTDEIQSIMNRHYEMTGIRMTIGNVRSNQKHLPNAKSYLNLLGSNNSNNNNNTTNIKRPYRVNFYLYKNIY